MIGNYEIRGELGRGAMGVVYRAFDPGLQREVAIKVLKARPDPRALGRFRHEGQAAARVQHPNVLAVHDLVIPETGLPYLVTDYAPGGSLRDRTLNRPPLPAEEIVQILDPLLAGVSALHEVGVVHRDLKPENVLFDEGGSPLVADLGLARADDRESRYTQSGVLTGTPAYMAPEQLSGGTPTPATDVYSLGVILYELLCGRLPFEAESLIEQIDSLLRKTPPRPRSIESSVDLALEAICLRCLAKDPSERFSDAADLRLAIQAWTPAGAPSASPSLLLPLALLASLGALAGALALVLGGGEAPGPVASTTPSAAPSPSASLDPGPAAPKVAPKIVLNARSLASLEGLEARRIWSLREVDEGLRLRSFNGDGAQFTIPLRFRRPGLRIRARYLVRRLHVGTALRLALVPDEPINPGGRPGGVGIFSCSLIAQDPDQRGLIGFRVSYREREGGQLSRDEVGLQPTTRPGPREVEFDLRVLENEVLVHAGGETQTYRVQIPPGEYRLELGPTPQGYLPDDPSREQGYRTRARSRLVQDFELEGYDVVLRGLELYEDSAKVRLASRTRLDAWAEAGTAAVAAWSGEGQARHFQGLASQHRNPHVRDEALFMGSLLTADMARGAGFRTLEALERLYLDSKGLNRQTWWFDDLGYGLQGDRLLAWVQAGLQVNDLPRARAERLALAHGLLGFEAAEGAPRESYHAAARALYCLLADRRGGIRQPALGVAWLYNGDLDRARSILDPAARTGATIPRVLYFAGLAAYWESDFKTATEHWGQLPAGYLSSDRQQQRVERAERLAKSKR